MKFLYARISTSDGSQKIERQLVGKAEYDEVFEDYVSGSTVSRPKLQEMLEKIKEGDVVETDSIDRLARNTMDLLNLVKNITEEKKAVVYFKKENLRFNGSENNPFHSMMLQVMASMAEFERNMIKKRQAEGIAIAKAKGVYNKKRHRGTKLDLTEMQEIQFYLRAKYTVKSICQKFGITRMTLYRYKQQGFLIF